MPQWDPARRVLGVIRPTVEAVGNITRTGAVGLVGTPGTVASQSYDLELAKLHPGIRFYSHACPMWVPLVENLESNGPGADYFVKRDIEELLKKAPDIDTLILGCTHYPLLIDKIRQFAPSNLQIVLQGEIVANSLLDYLQRHPDMDARITRNGTTEYITTEEADKFSNLAAVFMGKPVKAHRENL